MLIAEIEAFIFLLNNGCPRQGRPFFITNDQNLKRKKTQFKAFIFDNPIVIDARKLKYIQLTAIHDRFYNLLSLKKCHRFKITSHFSMQPSG